MTSSRFLTAWVAGCGFAVDLPAAPAPPEVCTACLGSATEPIGTVEGRELFAMPDAWQDDRGEPRKLSQFAARPQLVAMFYADCHMVCPITVETLRTLERELAAAQIDAGILLVTLDPSTDSVATLAAYRRERKLSDRWTLLRGTTLATRRLAESLGIPFRIDAVRIAHGSVIVVTDARGKIVAHFTGLHPDLAALRQAVGAAATEVRPK